MFRQKANRKQVLGRTEERAESGKKGEHKRKNDVEKYNLINRIGRQIRSIKKGK